MIEIDFRTPMDNKWTYTGEVWLVKCSYQFKFPIKWDSKIVTCPGFITSTIDNNLWEGISNIFG